MKTIFQQMKNRLSAGEALMLVSITAASGAVPRGAGAHMLVGSGGRICGTIGGGCSEAAALAKARRIIGTGKTAVIDFDMSSEVAEENGMVCGGCMTVLIEDVDG